MIVHKIPYVLYILSATVISDATAVTSNPYPQLSAAATTPPADAEVDAIHYIGAGYNIYKGNPDGGSWSYGGDDPGVLLSKKILNIDQGNAPSQVEIGKHGCQVFRYYNLIYNTKSYQDRLRLFVHGEAGQQNPGGQFAFSLSADYNSVYHQTDLLHYVFQEYTTICNLGDARYKSYSAMESDFPLTADFAASICSLPELYSQNTYMTFLDTWGTHVITEVVYGKRATNRYKMRLNEYFSYLLHHVHDDINVGGPMMGFQSSLSVDMDSFQYRPEYNELIGSFQQEISSGGSSLFDNNKLIISSLDEVINKIQGKFWTSFERFGNCVNKTPSIIQSWASNLNGAILDYPDFKRAKAPQDTGLQMPLTWPNGTYALQSTDSGCPGETTWVEGTRHEEMERQDPDSDWSANNHFGGTLTSAEFDLKFCTKTQTTSSGFETDWPKGDYCVYKYGPCPAGFQEGLLHIDDENTHNGNSYTGILPDGVYNEDTTFNYCCRSDGAYVNQIWLPNSKPFYLFKYKSNCQKVQGMSETEESLYWDGEDWDQRSYTSGSHPAIDDYHYGARVYFCFYQPNNPIETGSIIIGK